MSLWNEFSAYFAEAGIATFGEDLFWGSMPDSPDTCLAVYEYQGRPPVHSKTRIESSRPRLQIVSRSKNYAEATARALLVYEHLSHAVGIRMGETRLDSARALQEPFADPRGRDEKGRIKIFCNYELKRIST